MLASLKGQEPNLESNKQHLRPTIIDLETSLVVLRGRCLILHLRTTYTDLDIRF